MKNCQNMYIHEHKIFFKNTKKNIDIVSKHQQETSLKLRINRKTNIGNVNNNYDSYKNSNIRD